MAVDPAYTQEVVIILNVATKWLWPHVSVQSFQPLLVTLTKWEECYLSPLISEKINIPQNIVEEWIYHITHVWCPYYPILKSQLLNIEAVLFLPESRSRDLDVFSWFIQLGMASG